MLDDSRGDDSHNTLEVSISLALPHDLKAERDVLGSMLRSAAMIDEVRSILDKSDFFIAAHQLLCGLIFEVADKHGPEAVDLTTVGALAHERGVLTELAPAGQGYAYLADLLSLTPVAANGAHYARIVARLAEQRAVIHVAHEALREAYHPHNGDTFLETVEQSILSIRDRRLQTNVRPIKHGLFALADRVDAVAEGKAVGLMTGFVDLDIMGLRFRPGDLVIAAARTSEGKSIFGGQLALRTALQDGPVFFASLEMETIDIVGRMVSAHVGLDASVTGGRRKATVEEARTLANAVNSMADLPIWIDDSFNQSVPIIAANARRIKRKHGLALVVVDYVQLLQTETERGQSRWEALGKVSRGLKRMAKELQVPVLTLAQLNREADRDDELRLSHLRESGNLEQDADIVILFRRGVVTDSEPEGDSLIHLTVAKNRGGPLGRVTLVHDKPRMRFINCPTGIGG